MSSPGPRKARRVVLEKLAGQIVGKLFVHGATRLALKRGYPGPEQDLGGWCKAAAQDQVLLVLRASLPDPPKAKR